MVTTVLFSLCLVVLILIWTKNQWSFRRRPFFFGFHILLDQKPTYFVAAKTFFFFLVFTYFWYEKGCHHEIPPRVPPFLATLWPWPEDSEETFRSSSQTAICLPHTVEASYGAFLLLNVKQESCEDQFL